MPEINFEARQCFYKQTIQNSDGVVTITFTGSSGCEGGSDTTLKLEIPLKMIEKIAEQVSESGN